MSWKRAPHPKRKTVIYRVEVTETSLHKAIGPIKRYNMGNMPDMDTKQGDKHTNASLQYGL